MAFFDIFKSSNQIQQESSAALYSAREKTTQQVDKHLSELIKKRNVGVKLGNWGKVDSTKWNKTIQTFFDQVIRPQLTATEIDAIKRYDPSRFAQVHIEERVKWNIQTSKWKSAWQVPSLSQKVMTGAEYEKYCTNLLTQQGWTCATTPLSGDQGADIIGLKASKKLVVQCKLYSSSVGNQAVQEVIAARTFYRADFAAVITNSTYTRSAKELAISAGVVLMTHEEVPEIETRLRLVPKV